MRHGKLMVLGVALAFALGAGTADAGWWSKVKKAAGKVVSNVKKGVRKAGAALKKTAAKVKRGAKRVWGKVKSAAGKVGALLKAKTYDVIVTGRCAYRDAAGKLVPVAGARVEAWDDDAAPKKTDWLKGCRKGLGNSCIGKTTTNTQGRFTIRGRVGDTIDLKGVFKKGADKPDVYVRCWLRNKDQFFFKWGTIPLPYEKLSRVRRNVVGRVNVGDVTFTGKAADAARLFGMLRDTIGRMRRLGVGRDLKPVLVMHPHGYTGKSRDPNVPPYAASFAFAIVINYLEGAQKHTVAHEFGHTAQFMYAIRSPKSGKARALGNLLKNVFKVVGKLGGGHSYWSKTNPQFAWAEGWGHFIALATWNPTFDSKCDKWKSNETGAESERVKIEGVVACRLYDITKKHGFKAVWESLKASKAMDFPTFRKGFKKSWKNPHQ